MSRRSGRAILCWALLVCFSPAWGFGALGHRLIADLAQQELEPAALAVAEQLLDRRSPRLLAEIASWADEARDRPEWRHTAPWHYSNFPQGSCTFEQARDCPRGQCLVPVLQEQLRLLSDVERSRSERAQALRFVVHLYGDLHQPLHLGFAHDKGGNTFQLSFPPSQARRQLEDSAETTALKQWWASRRQGSNLHQLWDTLLLESAGRSEASLLQHLQQQPLKPVAASLTDVIEVAAESCAQAQAADFYPAGHRLSLAYMQAQRPRLEQQLRLAGTRLARVLNVALVP